MTVQTIALLGHFSGIGPHCCGWRKKIKNDGN